MVRYLIALFAMTLAIVAVAAGCAAAPRTGDARYSWQRPHAKVIETGDLEWAPKPFVFQAGESVRYIDFEDGDDAGPGTREDPWKHHPWDPAATGQAAECEGVDTYVFKRGVIYRGRLVADESGEAAAPIRLTSDPSWGSGDAAIHGSGRLTGGWQRCEPDDAPAEMPRTDMVWYQDIGTDQRPTALWEMRDGRIIRIPLARDPNWEVTNPDDVKSEWYEWKNVEKETLQADGNEKVKAWGMDAEHLTADAPDAYVGATVWTEYSGVMGSPYPNPIEAYDPERDAIRFAGPWGDASSRAPILHCRYFLENSPRFLDAPGEYYYAAEGPFAGRLYVRLPGDRNPNQSAVEVPRPRTILDIRNQSHIHVSGLTFRFHSVAHWYDRWWQVPTEDASCVKALGDCEDIRVSNCFFEHTVRAIWAQTLEEGQFMDGIEFTDNEVVHSDYGPVWIVKGSGELHGVRVMRNRLYHVGTRPMRSEHGHALRVGFPNLMEVAGNVLDRCWGAGIFLFGGKGGGRHDAVPLGRYLVHHNKVTDPLLNTNDWGGIEFWQGGPAYIYDNVSGNPGGYWHWSHVMRGDTAEERSHGTARFGFAYYLDGAFKQYVFNNIAWGKSNDLTSPLCNNTGLQEVIGFLNAAFNNTFYKFGAGARRHGPHGGRNCYVGNLWSDISDLMFRHSDAKPPEDRNLARLQGGDYPVDTLAYTHNIFHELPRTFGHFESSGIRYETLEAFREALEDREPLASSVGSVAEKDPLRDAEGHDFRPAEGSAVVDGGVRFFVPWALYAEVGQWHFYKNPSDPSRILGEHWYMTEPYVGRGMYRHLPRHDLTAEGVSLGDYTAGELEDWTEGALTFNGRDQRCVLSDREMREDITWGEDNVYPGEKRKTLDMDTNNFLVEALFRTEPGHTGGTLVAKMGDAGYAVRVNQRGGASLTIADGNAVDEVACGTPVNDGGWHHLIAEADRRGGVMHIYVDGRQTAMAAIRNVAPTVSLSNRSDFVVAEQLPGAIDFLRVARGTLADAETTIEELYEWEFNGPFLKDFFGNDPVGRRDAGAIEAR